MTGAYEEGRTDGFTAGWRHGLHAGRCQRILADTFEPPAIKYDMHVAYVQEGLIGLNEGILDALQGLVSRVTPIPPEGLPLERFLELAPDLVLVLNGVHAFPPEMAAVLRLAGIPTAVWFADDPYFTDVTRSIALHYDYVFTHELSCVPFYQSLGVPRVYYLPLAAGRNVFYPRLVGSEYKRDVVFIGTAFWNRVDFFDRLLPLLKGRSVFLSGGLWNRLKDYPHWAEHIRLEGTPLADTSSYYNGAKIVVNLHRSPDNGEHNRNAALLPALSINPRTYEINACGTLQMTDVRPDLIRFYTPGEEIETYATPEELAGKIHYYLEHEEHRSAIALKGLERTLREHTYRGRLDTLLQTVLEARG
ncbi:CgeB family protein [Gorillibacterium sp. sgz5001074]|uniref:CgeB family protein n=1 Tax=Gorillibacterium sp. sgz5001074 TaxID=3446695 RepID=UPI003F667FA8